MTNYEVVNIHVRWEALWVYDANPFLSCVIPVLMCNKLDKRLHTLLGDKLENLTVFQENPEYLKARYTVRQL